MIENWNKKYKRYEKTKIFENRQKYNYDNMKILKYGNMETLMACITSSIDLLYLIKTSWCRWIFFIKEN